MTILYLDIARRLYFLVVPFAFLPKNKKMRGDFTA